MFIGMRLFCAFFLIGCCDSGTAPKKTRHRIKGIPLSVWRVFFLCCNVGPGEERVAFSGVGGLSVHFGHGARYFDVGRRFPVDRVFDATGKHVEAVPGFRRNGQGIGPSVAQDIAHLVLQPVPLVEDEDTRNFVQFHIGKDAVHSRDLAVELGMRGIGHMQQQIGGFQFLKGGLKSFGQFLWEVADKSDRIRQHKFVLFGEAEPPGGGVQRGEQLVFRQHLRTR